MVEGIEQADVDAAMRTFEKLAGSTLRYRESHGWHLRDKMAMREVLKEFATTLSRQSADDPNPQPRPDAEGQCVVAPAGWKLVPNTATRDWAYQMAVERHGRSHTPRCEPTPEREIDWAARRISEALAAAPPAPDAIRQPVGSVSVEADDTEERLWQSECISQVQATYDSELEDLLGSYPDEGERSVEAMKAALGLYDHLCATRSEQVAIRQPVGDRVTVEADLNAKLRARGMFTLDEMLGQTPMTQWMIHTGVKDMETFGQWLEMKTREYLTMKARYDVGEGEHADELKDWVSTHYAAFDTIRVNFRAILSRIATAETGGSGQSQAAIDVLAERKRQVEVHNWTSERDDRHDDGVLARAAAAYARHAGSDESARQINSGYAPEDLWEFGGMHPWRPSNPRRDLVKAGALILAEIQRLDRIADPATPSVGRQG